MKIEHAMLHDLIRIVDDIGFRAVAETDGLYNYGNEPVWLEIRGFVRGRSNQNPALSARKPGKKHFHPISLSWFTGNIGLEAAPKEKETPPSESEAGGSNQ